MKKNILWLIASVCMLNIAGAQKKVPQLFRANAADIRTNFMKSVQFSAANRVKSTAEEMYPFEKLTVSRQQHATGLKKDNAVSLTDEDDRLRPVARPSYAISPLVVINRAVSNEEGPDPMVAVGEKTVLVSNTDWLKFFDKSTGKVLQEVSTNGLFWQFVSPVIPGTSTPNPDYASNFYEIPTDVPYYCSKSKPCGVSDCKQGGYGSKDLPCTELTDEGLINEAYDVRVYYQKEHKRFVVVAALRNQSSKDNDCYNANGAIDCSQYLIRLVAVAVSATEHPADGFYVYRTGENNYRDWPNAFIDQDYLVIANLGGGDAYTNGRSLVTVYNFRQMKDGLSGIIQGFSIPQNNAAETAGSLIPVSNLLTNQNSEAFFFLENNYLDAGGMLHGRRSEGKAKIWYFTKPGNANAIFDQPPTQLKLAGEVGVENRSFDGGAAAGITYHNGFIYYSSFQKVFEATSTKRAGFGMNILKIPVIKRNNGSYEITSSTAAGFKHYEFRNEDYSYLDVSIAVDVFHNVAINFIRLPRSLSSSALPQIRCKVKFNQEDNWRASRLIKEWGNASDGGKRHVHYSWIIKDPYSINQFWMAQAFKNNNREGTWVDFFSLSDY